MGGILGTASGVVHLRDSNFSGLLKGHTSVGGLIGEIQVRLTNVFNNCVVDGNIIATGEYAGGLIGLTLNQYERRSILDENIDSDIFLDEGFSNDINEYENHFLDSIGEKGHTYFKGSYIIGNENCNILIGENHSRDSQIENIGYYIRGEIEPTNAQIYVNGELHLENSMELNGNEFVACINKTSYPFEYADDYAETIGFKADGYLYTGIPLLEIIDDTYCYYNFDLGKIVLLQDTFGDIQEVLSPERAVLNREQLSINKEVKYDEESVFIDITTTNNATWKLYYDDKCTQENQSHVMDLEIGLNTSYIKIISKLEENSKTYAIHINRLNKRPNMVTGLRAVDEMYRVDLYWDQGNDDIQ